MKQALVNKKIGVEYISDEEAIRLNKIDLEEDVPISEIKKLLGQL